MSPGTYTIDQLAVLFQRSASTLRGYLDELTSEHGFPRRLPCFDNLWSKPAVDRWLDGGPQLRIEPVAADPSDLRDAIERRYGSAA